jgi:DNA-directed RNA polymerase specialized sigma24 family protein
VREPVEEVAIVAAGKRELLLHVHRFRLRREDLEDCYSQATLELMLRVRKGGAFASPRHIANAIEQRFLSRIRDRRRALSGRSPMAAAMETASPLEPGDRLAIADARAELEQLVLMRQELRRIGRLARLLTPDQRLVLACQIGAQMPPADFCARYGWSAEKYRKVAQRARARLRRLMSLEEAG